MCVRIRTVSESPSLSLRFGFVFAIVAIAFLVVGLVGPKGLWQFRFGAIPFGLFAYICMRAHCRNRRGNHPNRQQVAHVNVTMDTQHSSSTGQPSCPVSSNLPPTSNEFSGSQSEVRPSSLSNYPVNPVAYDPSMPPPPFLYNTSSPAAQQDLSDFLPPPSYEEVMRGSR